MNWKSKWTYFAGAVALAAYFLARAGAPPVAIIAGVAFAALATLRPSRST